MSLLWRAFWCCTSSANTHLPKRTNTCIPLDTNHSQLEPADVIIVEGILVLHIPAVRDLLHMKVYVDTGAQRCAFSVC